MKDPLEGKFKIGAESDLVTARRLVRQVAVGVGFGLIDVTRIVTATSELTRNIYHYAGSGMVRWRVVQQSGRRGLELTFEDQGPGIPDVAKALQPGFSTGRGLGLGLPGAKRLMDEMSVESTPGHGTTVQIRRWLRG